MTPLEQGKAWFLCLAGCFPNWLRVLDVVVSLVPVALGLVLLAVAWGRGWALNLAGRVAAEGNGAAGN